MGNVALVWTGLPSDSLPLLPRNHRTLLALARRVASGAFRTVLSLLLVAEAASGIEVPLAEGDEPLDFWVATEVGVVDDSCEVAFEADPPFFDELGIGVGFLPEVGDGEGREFELVEGLFTSSLSRLSWMCLSSL